MAGVKRCVAVVSARVDRVWILLIGSSVAWYLWVVSRGVASQYELELTSSYVVAPAVLIAGIMGGSILRRLPQRNKVVYLLILVLLATVISWPIYAIAETGMTALVKAIPTVSGTETASGSFFEDFEG